MRALITALLALTVTGCGQAGGGGAAAPGGSPDPALPRDETYLSSRLEGHTLVSGTRIRMEFTHDGKVAAYAGCNHLAGKASLKDGRLVVTDLGGTEMACDEDLTAQDAWLKKFLTGSPRWHLVDHTLTLTRGDTEIQLLNERIAQPDRELVGTRWRLDTVIDGEAASSVPANVKAWLRFTKDGKVQGNTGCNGFGGTYQLDEDAKRPTVTIDDVVMTMRACTGDVMSVEMTMSEVLQGTVAYQLKGNKLMLVKKPGKALGFQAG